MGCVEAGLQVVPSVLLEEVIAVVAPRYVFGAIPKAFEATVRAIVQAEVMMT